MLEPLHETDGPPRRRHAICRADASVGLGQGHVRRCLVLAASLAEVGWDVTFATTGEAVRLVPALRDGVFPCHVFEPGDDPGALRAAWPGGCDLLVVDHYGLDAVYETACRGWAKRMLVIDDLADRSHDCDILLDQGPGRAAADYRGLVPTAATLLLGPRFALIDPRFRRARLQHGQRGGAVRRILVNFGSSDSAGATLHALGAIAASGFGGAVEIILASAAPDLDAVRTRAAALAPGVTVEVRTDVADMPEAIGRADLAIGAGGVGALERCCVGLPSLIVTVADNQRTNAAGLAARGAAVDLGPLSELPQGALAAALAALAADGARRAAMRAAALQVVDGLGVARIRAAIDPPPWAKDGQPVSLRAAVLEDAPLLFAWQTTPGMRRFARNPALPTWAEHEAWIKAKLAEPNRVFDIILHGGVPVGVLRFDPLDAPDAWEISILVIPDRQNLGIAAAALVLGRRLFPHDRIVAAIAPQNAASQRLFARAGYCHVGGWEWRLAPDAGAAVSG